MATRDVTKRTSHYRGSELEPELIIDSEVETHASGRTVARLALLWQERRFLFRCAAIGLVASTLLVFLIPVRYTSTTQLMPPDQVGAGLATALSAFTKGSGSGSDLGALGTELLGLRTSSDLFIGVLHSRTVEDDLINKFDLRKLYGDRRIENARKDLTNRTDIASDRKSGIVTIKVTDKNPQRAAAMAREYVDELNQIVVTLNTSSAHKERVFLENRLQQVQQDLESAEKDFGQFASKNTALDVKEQGKAMIGAEAELEGQLIAAQTQLEGLRQIYTNENVRVRTLQARIEEYRRQLQKLNGNSNTAADDATSQGEAQSDQLYPSIRQLPILGVPWADLYRRTRVQEVVFETLTKQYEIAKVEEAREVPSVKVLDAADVPEQKSFPPRILLILFGTVLVLAASVGWVLARERWQKIDATDPGKVLALEIWQTVRKAPVVSRTLQFVRMRFVKNGTPPGIHVKDREKQQHDDSAE
jgi:capsule polysaccharide export protein KpsE/RkpR